MDPFSVVYDNIVSFFDSIPAKYAQSIKENQTDQPPEHMVYPRAFLDEAAQNNICGHVVHIIMEDNLQYQIFWNGGKGSNIKVEAMALAGLLFICHFLNIQTLHIWGDSKVIIDHVSRKHHIKEQHLMGWMNRISSLWRQMEDYSIRHIYKSQNQQADILSKKALLSQLGIWNMEVIFEAERFLI